MDRQGGSDSNDILFQQAFAEEVAIDSSNETVQRQDSSGPNISNISQILQNNGIDLRNLSQGFATSTLQGEPRRCSARQAAKRAPLSVPRPPTPVSPIAEESSLLSPGTSAAIPTPSPQRSSFVPRRREISNSRCCSNFRSPLNVNVGQEFSSDNTLIDMHIPSDLVLEFGKLSKANTDN